MEDIASITLKGMYCNKDIHKEYEVVEDDGIYSCEEFGNGTSSKKLIMSKEAFIEAFSKYCRDFYE